MARKKKHEEHENHERWLVSYADFITLLFAFFVVMYSVSSVNEGKYRVLSDTLQSSFKQAGKSDQPIQIGQIARTLNPFNEGLQTNADKDTLQHIIQPIQVAKQDPDSLLDIAAGQGSGLGEGMGPGLGMGDSDDAKEQQIRDMADEIKTTVASLIDQNLVIIRELKDGVEIEIKSRVLFPSGSASLSIDAEKLLIRLAASLARFPSSMQVEGHTDDSPVNSARYESNWELSAARAATVVNLFAEHDMDPTRMWAVGYANYKPATDAGAVGTGALNRRVVLMLRPNQAEPEPEPDESATSLTPAPEPEPVPEPVPLPLSPISETPETAPTIIAPPIKPLGLPQALPQAGGLIPLPQAPQEAVQ